MGKRNGSIGSLRRIGAIDEQQLEMAVTLVAAYPHPVPYDRCRHLSTGDWADRPIVANTAVILRRMLGRDSIVTMRNRGYQAGPMLAKRLAKLMSEV